MIRPGQPGWGQGAGYFQDIEQKTIGPITICLACCICPCFLCCPQDKTKVKVWIPTPAGTAVQAPVAQTMGQAQIAPVAQATPAVPVAIATPAVPVAQAVPVQPSIHVACGSCQAVVSVPMIEGAALQFQCPTCGAINQLGCGVQVNAEDSNQKVELPPYWEKVTNESVDKNHDGVSLEEADAAVSQRVPCSNDIVTAVQGLFDNTWKDKTTRDRKFEKPPKLQVVQVIRNENAKLYSRYFLMKKKIAELCKAKSDFQQYTCKTGEVPALQNLLATAELDPDVNEFYLFHGTSPDAANAICENDFLIKKAGSSTGTLYGPGMYFAEASSKSDEYAKCDEGLYQGLYAILMCRVTCGHIKYSDEKDPDVQDLVDSVAVKHTHHSILGDREKCRGTYREFIVFDKDQAYPEYVVIYRRVPME